MGLLDRKTPPAPKQEAPPPAAEVKQLEAIASPTTGVLVSADIANLLLEDAGAGQETMGKEDFAIPRLGILQSLNPQCAKRESTYIEGAEPGLIWDGISGEMIDGEEGILAIPVSFRRTNIEWKLNRGGFVADHGNDDACLADCTKDDKGAMINLAGNVIVPTAEYLCLVVDGNGGARQVSITMSKSQLKKSRKWNTMISQLQVPKPGGGVFNPAMFYRSYKLTTVPESNDQGSWFGWDIKPGPNTLDLENGEAMYLSCRSFRNLIATGDIKVAAHDTGADGAIVTAADDDGTL